MKQLTKESIISVKDKGRFASICSTHLSDFLNTKIGVLEVLDELLLYECGMKPKNKVLSIYIINLLKEVTVNK